MWVEFQSELVLYGRLDSEAGDDSVCSIAFNDSIQYKSITPYPFDTFMSRDTLYYSSDAGPNVVSRGHSALFDTMLACLFTGPALHLSFHKNSQSYEVTHNKEDCESGEYTRLDLPYALGIFFADAWIASVTQGSRWAGVKTIPRYSGMGHRPAIRIQTRIVQVKDSIATAVLSSDTTLSNMPTILPNGESATIIQNTIHLGGTLFLAQESGIPLRGEIRIEESMQIIRPKLSDRAIEKECAYILRFRIY
ncbi:MAG: hypothetical protein ABIA59_11685 [Candidatus Latescibacterota bacterium]